MKISELRAPYHAYSTSAIFFPLKIALMNVHHTLIVCEQCMMHGKYAVLRAVIHPQTFIILNYIQTKINN